MAFELTAGESVEAGVRRIVDEQLSSALEELSGADAKTADAAVHSARKRFKRVRAVLRLIRGELGGAVFASENAAFRDTGGSLSEARDAHVLVVTLATLKARVDPPTYAAARKLLMKRQREVRKRVLEQAGALDAVARAVRDARARVRGWAVARDGWPALKGGLKRVYGDGRRAFAAAHVGAPPDHFHAWRKRTKDLWHQLEILEPLWPAVLGPLADEAHTLADHLGDEHDLAVLKEVLEAEALARGDGGAGSALVGAIEVRRRELQQAARDLGGRLLAEKPGAFVRRLGKYWGAWAPRADTAAVPAPQVEGGIELHVAELPASAEVPGEPPAPVVDTFGNGD